MEQGRAGETRGGASSADGEAALFSGGGAEEEKAWASSPEGVGRGLRVAGVKGEAVLPVPLHPEPHIP